MIAVHLVPISACLSKERTVCATAVKFAGIALIF
jgi:hypothetical protein